MYDPQEIRDFNRVYIADPLRENDEESSIAPEIEAVNYLVWKRLQLSKAKLKGVTEMAALMAGFSVVATVELDVSKTSSDLLLVAFTVTTAFLVSTTMFSILIATCLLPHIDAATKLNSAKSLAKDSPHEDLIWYIDLAWFLANTVSICLFILDVVLLSWIKFKRLPAICITSIMIPVLLLLCIFSVIFYRQTVHYQIDMADKKYGELKAMGRKLRLGVSFSSSGAAVQTV